ncbi:hypothetical protein [Roseovarius sp. D22-M7]|uniref:hypothetical protein n=1 Tax=Roseovarius sp. D22-M7 TaxID=3127116 RepID=UPI00300F9DFA
MTRKDYNMIAAALNEVYRRTVSNSDRMTEITASAMVHTVANKLDAENPNFQRQRFLDACMK